MSYKFEVECVVKGGFPVLVRGSLYPSEPDVGIMGEYIDDYEILTVKGKSCEWLKLSQDQVDDLLVDAHEKIPRNDPDDYRDDPRDFD